MLPTETLPSFCRARVLILGVGNVLFGDDGFGPAVAERIRMSYRVPEDIYVMDVGTGVRKLLFTITLSEAQPEQIVIVDAVDWGQEVGRVAEIGVEALPVSKIDDFSLHQVPTSNMLHELQDRCGIDVSVVVCDVGHIPQVIQPGLTDEVASSVSTAVQRIAGRFELEKR